MQEGFGLRGPKALSFTYDKLASAAGIRALHINLEDYLVQPWSQNLKPANQKSNARAGGNGNRKKSKKMKRRIAQTKVRAKTSNGCAPKKRTWRAVSSMSRTEVEAWFAALPVKPAKKKRRPTATKAVPVTRRYVVRF